MGVRSPAPSRPRPLRPPRQRPPSSWPAPSRRGRASACQLLEKGVRAALSRPCVQDPVCGRSEVPCLRALPHPSRPLPPPSPASLRRRLGVLPSASSRTLHFLRPLFPLWLAWACLPPGRAPSDSGGFVGRPFLSRLRLPGLIEKGPRWHGTAAFHFMLPCSFPPFTLSTPSPRPLLMSGRDFCSLFPWAEVGTRRAARPRETVRTLGGQQLLLL